MIRFIRCIGKNRILPVLILCCFYGNVRAQYGYLGKRNIIKFDVLVSPAASNPNFKGNRSLSAWNNDFGVIFERVIDRKHMIELGVGLGKARYYNFSNEMYLFKEDYLEGNTPDIMTYRKVSLGYTLFWKKKGHIAPIGSYKNIRLTLFDNLIGENFNDNPYYYKRHKSLIVSFFVGRKSVFFDKLIIDYSGGLGIGLDRGGQAFMKYISGNFLTDDRQISEATARLYTKYLFQIRLGIGFIR